ncbi:TPA: hypothetical protein HA239_02190 [Candidatus Woesearchaeota archaeon]|nr:hypothetical protein QT06_C0001G1042 [archaeon GW2011_AR15]MBS3104487.1 hypothetical protein [Candidatus Woesearchaeota archaeon]HIH41199.1 hypothetical protein [Candidatus Woesearchaeota archaeon]
MDTFYDKIDTVRTYIEIDPEERFVDYVKLGTGDTKIPAFDEKAHLKPEFTGFVSIRGHHGLIEISDYVSACRDTITMWEILGKSMVLQPRIIEGDYMYIENGIGKYMQVPLEIKQNRASASSIYVQDNCIVTEDYFSEIDREAGMRIGGNDLPLKFGLREYLFNLGRWHINAKITTYNPPYGGPENSVWIDFSLPEIKNGRHICQRENHHIISLMESGGDSNYNAILDEMEALGSSMFSSMENIIKALGTIRIYQDSRIYDEACQEKNGLTNVPLMPPTEEFLSMTFEDAISFFKDTFI